MSVIVKSDPAGVDTPIDTIQRALYTGLVTNGSITNYESYHRAYINKESNDSIEAQRYTANGEYEDVFTNDDFTVTSFFIADQVRPVPDLIQSGISVIFQVNLDDALPGVTTRADEEFNNLVFSILDKLSGDIVVDEIVTGITNVYAEFDQDKIPWDDIQPYYVVRFNLTANYFYDCSKTFGGVTCTIAVAMSGTNPTSIGGSDGTATATASGTLRGSAMALASSYVSQALPAEPVTGPIP